MPNDRSDKKITIYDISVLAQASPSAVGAVLNGTWKKRRISAKLAERIQGVAAEHGYTPNLQARALRKEKSGIIGMIVPIYDNRYFSSLIESFEQHARAGGLFPVVTCTQRKPDLEVQATQSMIAYRVETIVCVGATDPDRIADLCHMHNVKVINVDLPGTKAPSIISDNYWAAHALTNDILQRMLQEKSGETGDLLFIGGRISDHNTRERIRGFEQAHRDKAIKAKPENRLPCGYAAEKAERVFDSYVGRHGGLPAGLFVNSTISLEGIVRWFEKNGLDHLQSIALGCFDWDPYAALLGKNTSMVRQNVEGMIDLVFKSLPDLSMLPPKITMVKPEIIYRHSQSLKVG